MDMVYIRKTRVQNEEEEKEGRWVGTYIAAMSRAAAAALACGEPPAHHRSRRQTPVKAISILGVPDIRCDNI